MKSQKPVYCMGRQYQIVDCKTVSYYHVFILNPLGVKVSLRKQIEVDANSIDFKAG